MPVTVDAIKELVVAAMTKKFGAELGAAYGFLMFGGFGVPGLVDGAELAIKADALAAAELTEDLALGLVGDLAKKGMAVILESRAASALAKVGLAAGTVATMSLIIVSGLLESTPIGAEEAIPGPVQGPSAANLTAEGLGMEVLLHSGPKIPHDQNPNQLSEQRVIDFRFYNFRFGGDAFGEHDQRVALGEAFSELFSDGYFVELEEFTYQFGSQIEDRTAFRNGKFQHTDSFTQQIGKVPDIEKQQRAGADPASLSMLDRQKAIEAAERAERRAERQDQRAREQQKEAERIAQEADAAKKAAQADAAKKAEEAKAAEEQAIVERQKADEEKKKKEDADKEVYILNNTPGILLRTSTDNPVDPFEAFVTALKLMLHRTAPPPDKDAADRIDQMILVIKDFLRTAPGPEMDVKTGADTTEEYISAIEQYLRETAKPMAEPFRPGCGTPAIVVAFERGLAFREHVSEKIVPVVPEIITEDVIKN